MRIAILEDNADILLSFATMLEIDGHTVDVYTNAGECMSALLDAFHNFKPLPEVVLVDVTIEHSINGIETIERLRHQLHPADIQFILMTDESAADQRVLEQWMRDIQLIKKPTRRETLLHHIKKFEKQGA